MYSDSNYLDVIIVGAGISGVAAAHKLISNGFKVKILEARDRIGGRIETISFGDELIDMGASWIHGIGPSAGDLPRWKGQLNPIYEIAKSNNLITTKSWDHESTAKIGFYGYKFPGKAFESSEISDLVDRINDHVDSRKDLADKNESLERILSSFDPKADKYLFDAVASHMFCQDDAAELPELSAKYFDEVMHFDGQEHVFIGGYDKIIEVLAKDVTIELNQIIVEVDYSGNLVVLTTDKGKKFYAERIIITVPLGVLHSGKIKFIPELSSEKSAAIKRLGMGLMDKLWLEFPEAFWKNDYDSDWICYASETYGLWVDTLNVFKYTGKPLLCMFNIGSAAVHMSGLSDEEVLESAMKAIRNWYPDAPGYIRYARTNWGTDPFAFGSYPFIRVGATSEDFHLYRESKSTFDKVYFAGDGTVSGMVGCVHAGYISGVDAAQNIIDLQNHEKAPIQISVSNSKFNSMILVLSLIILIIAYLVI